MTAARAAGLLLVLTGIATAVLVTDEDLLARVYGTAGGGLVAAAGVLLVVRAAAWRRALGPVVVLLLVGVGIAAFAV